MELNDYPHFDLTEDGRLCSMGQHCPGFPRVLYDALIGSEPDTGVELMAHIALTSLCEDYLVATVALPITLLPIQN
jgi:hypothetical protein